MLASRQTGIKPDENGFSVGGNDGTPYTFENRKATLASIRWMTNPNPLRTANLRAPYAQGRCFASESQMDEMAAAASIDPVEFRLRYLGDNTRAAAVLRAAFPSETSSELVQRLRRSSTVVTDPRNSLSLPRLDLAAALALPAARSASAPRFAAGTSRLDAGWRCPASRARSSPRWPMSKWTGRAAR